MITVGIDEAGRGPVIGSLFIAGVAASDEQLERLQELGLKDSKKLSDNRRRKLGEKVEQIADDFYVREITASEIDELRKIMSLNVIEIQGFVEVIHELAPDTVIIDLPEPDGDRFAAKIRNKLDANMKDTAITAEHGADDTYPLVSAASILAKNARERHVEQLHDKYGHDFKSGYPHDAPTIDFLEDYLDEYGELPPETRLSWSTSKRLLKEAEQRNVYDYWANKE